MITPGFFGFFNAHRGMVSAQNAISVISHNISNAATPGYSRQRIDLAAYIPYASPSLSRLSGGQPGQGSTVQQITRSRDIFLDNQYRKNNSSYQAHSVKATVLQQMESILNEPSANGVNSAMQSFFDAAQEMSLHPESLASHASFAQNAIDMVNVFQQQAGQLADLQQNLVGNPNLPGSFSTSQAALTVNQVNSMLSQIATLNKSISAVSTANLQSNDLLDQRDRLLDELSGLVDIDVKYHVNGLIDLSIAGQSMLRGVDQLNSLEVVQNTGSAPSPAELPILLRTVLGGNVLNDGAGSDIQGGKLKGILDLGTGTIQNILNQLNVLLNETVSQVNSLQTSGRDQDGNLGAPLFLNDPTLNPDQNLDIFHWKVNPDIIENPKLLASANNDATEPSGFTGVGDGRNALAIAQLRDRTFTSLQDSKISDYVGSLVSKLGIESKTEQSQAKSGANILQTVDTWRQSVSGVNLDEEVINLMSYQHLLEATSKMLSVLDDR